MASLPFLSPTSHFLPKGGGALAPARTPTPQHQPVDPSRSSHAFQASLLPDDPSARILSPVLPRLPRSLFDPLGAARPTSSGRARTVTATRSLFDPLPSAVRSSSDGRPAHAGDAVPSLVVPVAACGLVAASRPVAASSAAVGCFPVAASEPDAASRSVERTEAALREAGLAGRCWRGDTLSSSPLPSTPSGFRSLDEELPGGGWPARCLIELLLSRTGVGEIRFLAATLSALTRAGRQIVLLAPPHVPDPTGWQQLGIDMRRVLVVRAERPADRLWAIEQSLKSGAFGALLAWLPEEKTLARHDALRRLQSVAAAADGLSFLLRPAAAQFQASPAPLRLTLATGRPERDRRTLSVRLIKRRGPVLAQPLTLLLPEIHRGMRLFGKDRSEVENEATATSGTSSSMSARTNDASVEFAVAA